MWENVKLREKRKEKAFMEETKTFQPKPTLYLPTDSFIFKRLYSFTVFILQQWDISKLNKITTTRIQKNVWNFTAVLETIFLNYTLKIIVTSQVFVSEKKHLSMLIDKDFRSVITISLLR